MNCVRSSPVNMRECPDQPHQASSSPVAILWDMENCPIPGEVNTDEVAGNVRRALRIHPAAAHGCVTLFSAYGDFNHFPRRLREGCQRTGINLIDIPNGRKDASDKAILVDMFLFALDNPPPCTILLISGDVDFAPALHKLGQRGYTVLLALPAGHAVASALFNAGQYVWDWPSVARGEGFVSAELLRRRAREQRNLRSYGNVSGGSSDDSDHLLEDEACLQGRYGAREKVVNGGAGEYPHVRHVAAPPGCAMAMANEDVREELWVQPGDIEGLKSQLIKLLKLNGGRLRFGRIGAEYKKIYGRPLFLAEYGLVKLADLLKQMSDTFEIAIIGGKKQLCLQECAPVAAQTKLEGSSVCGNAATQQRGSLSISKEDDHDSVKEVILLRAKDHGKTGTVVLEAADLDTALSCEYASIDATKKKNAQEQVLKLDTFKHELQELLVSHACRIWLARLWKVYHQRYLRELDVAAFGVADLDELLERVQDIATVIEEEGTRRKFLVVSKSDASQAVGEEGKTAAAKVA